MTQYNKLRIEWDCRRGMLELDNVIMPFYRQHFDALSDTQKDTFIRLLACSDLQLFLGSLIEVWQLILNYNKWLITFKKH